MSGSAPDTGMNITVFSEAGGPEPCMTVRIRIRSEHVTRFRMLRLSALCRMFQEISIAHTTALGMGREKTLDRGLLWVISRQHMEILRLPVYDEEITLRSWPGEMTGFFFPRFYEILSGDECIVRGEALWLLMEESTRKAVFPSAYGVVINGVSGERGKPVRTLSGAIRPADGSVLCGDYPQEALFSRTDINGHVGNAYYYDMIDDVLEEEALRRAPRTVEAEYLQEIRPGSRFLLRAMRQPDPFGSRYFEGLPESFSESGAAKPLFRIRTEYAGRK